MSCCYQKLKINSSHHDTRDTVLYMTVKQQTSRNTELQLLAGRRRRRRPFQRTHLTTSWSRTAAACSLQQSAVSAQHRASVDASSCGQQQPPPIGQTSRPNDGFKYRTVEVRLTTTQIVNWMLFYTATIASVHLPAPALRIGAYRICSRVYRMWRIRVPLLCSLL